MGNVPGLGSRAGTCLKKAWSCEVVSWRGHVSWRAKAFHKTLTKLIRASGKAHLAGFDRGDHTQQVWQHGLALSNMGLQWKVDESVIIQVKGKLRASRVEESKLLSPCWSPQIADSMIAVCAKV
jgi:hypothetical protein